jgi:type IV pilus assembly protein PilB
MVAEKKRLGDILVETGKLTEEQLHDALRYKEEHNTYLGKAIVTLGFLTEKELAELLSVQLGIPYLNLLTYDIQDDVLRIVDEKFALRHKIMPLFFIENTITVATADPLNVQMVDELSQKTGMDVNLVLATESDIEQAIDLFYGAARYEERTRQQPGQRGAQIVSREIDQDTEIIEAVNMLFNEAIKIGASDIHIEPRENDVRIRFRVDGVLQQHYTVPKASMAPLISRVKILADMDIAESRKPQDGRFSYTGGEKKVDMRTSTYPTPNGEKVVLRILDESKGKIELHKLGFEEKMLEEWRRVIHLPNGIILVSGPTGSGKTTTLYATLNVINTVDVNIMTIEDPIEYRLENIIQGQVNPKAGLTFAAALRSMLRQDPDIIMVGEMRDVETVELAIRAALTGHLVFSTIHTNDAASCFTRMLDMGIDPYLVSSTVRAVLAQRLIRLLCPRCKKSYTPSPELLQSLKLEHLDEPPLLFQPVGCIHCRNSGYFGRAGVFELLVPGEEIEGLVNRRANATQIQEVAVKNGMITLRDAAMQYVLAGKTSVDEIFRVTLV